MCAWFATDPEHAAPLQADAASAPATRREALRWTLAALLGLGLLGERSAHAASDELAFAAGSFKDVLAALGGQPVDGPEVTISVPELVENGALVPVEVSSRLPGAQSIYLISESNPFPLVAKFDLPEGTEAFLATRIKVAASCTLYAVIRSGERLHWASRYTRVTVGGCGG